MEQKLSTKLQPIYDLELSLGNTVVQIRETSKEALPLAIIFKEPLHRKEVESAIKIVAPIAWYSVGAFAGYVCENSRQSLQGPTSTIAEAAQHARQKLSANLHVIYDLELSLGNAVVRVDEPAGSLCPLAIIFKNPLHRTEIRTTLSLSPAARRLENHDPHYETEGGYRCEETGHVIAGPLR